MAKRSRRPQRREPDKQPKSRVELPETRAGSASAPPVASSFTDSRPASIRVDFIQEYFYVYRDLKSIIIIAILMFAVMAALSFAI